MNGDNNLFNEEARLTDRQILWLVHQNVKDLKVTGEEQIKALDKRVSALESWRTWTIGCAAGIGILTPLIWMAVGRP